MTPISPVAESEILLSSLHRQLKAVADHPEHYWIGQILLDTLKRETGYIADSPPSDPTQEPQAVAFDTLYEAAVTAWGSQTSMPYSTDGLAYAISAVLELTEKPRPVSPDREAVKRAIYKNVGSCADANFIDRRYLTGVDKATDDILALIEGRT